MRIAIKFDYNTFLICPPGADVGPLLQSLTGGIICREDGYGKDRKYVPKDEGEQAFDLVLLPDDSVSLPDSQGENPWVKALKDSRDELTKVQSAQWAKDQKIKDLEAKLEKFSKLTE